ncbi:DUF2637 domain-containing protein, partial [Haloactinomyces albus]
TAENRRADRAAEREQDRTDREHRQAQRAQRGQQRRARLATLGRWVTARPVELAMAAIIVVPALLAWTAMATYGREIYGPIGVLLPLFTEAAMWAFAAKLHQARQHQAPTGWLQMGTWAFTAVAALLNYIHGHALGGIAVGLVMAVVSVGGVVTHQILTAAPMQARRSRTDRQAARTQRLAARRVTRMERVALRQAVGELGTDGTVSLLHQPGTVTLARAWTGRTRLDRRAVPGLAADGPTSPATPVADAVEQWLSVQPDPATESSPTDTDSTSALEWAESGADLQESTPAPVSIPEPNRRSLDTLRTELHRAVSDGVEVDPTSAESIRKTLRCGAKTARRLRDEWNDGSAAVAA